MKFRSIPVVLIPALLFAAFGVLSGCGNIFDPFDSPSGDAQLLSDARAYFDQGEFEKAAKLYAEISGDKADEVNADSAFRILDVNGASMGQFMISFGTGGGSIGKGLTSLANHMISTGGAAGKTKRLAILEAFQKINAITDPTTRGMVRFATATAMAAEILAEGASPAGLVPGDIANEPANCATATPDTCGANASCTGTLTRFVALEDTLTRLPLSGTSKMDGTAPDFYVFSAALEEMNVALNSEIRSGGSLGGGFISFLGQLNAVFRASLAPAQGRCARYSLLSQGIGTLK